MSISINKNDSNFATPKALAVGTTAGLGAAAAVKLAPVAKDAYVQSVKTQAQQIKDFKKNYNCENIKEAVKQWKDSWTTRIKSINAKSIANRMQKADPQNKVFYEDFANGVIEVGKNNKLKQMAKQAKIYENGKPIKRFALKDSLSAVGEKIGKKAISLKDKVVNFAKSKTKGQDIQHKATAIKNTTVEKGKTLKNVLGEFFKGNKKAWFEKHSTQLKKYGIPALIIGGTAMAATAVTKAILNHKAKSED